MIPGGREEHLRLVLQPPERLAVHDAVAITLKRRTHVVFGLRAKASAGSSALGRFRRKNLELALFERITKAIHGSPPENSCRASAGRHRSWRRASDRDRRTSSAYRHRRHGGHG